MAIAKYHAIAHVTLNSAQNRVTFSGIPANFRDLRIVANVIGQNSILDSDYISFNQGDGFLSNVQLYANGSSASSNKGTSVGRVSNYENTLGKPYLWTLDIFDYSQTDKHKSYLSRYNSDNAGVGMFAGRWPRTSVLNYIEIYPTTNGIYAAGSTFTLYGIK